MEKPEEAVETPAPELKNERKFKLEKVLDWKWGPPSEPRVIRESPAPDLRNRPTVWVLGAGCSRNYSGAAVLQGNYPNLKPPLQADFFQMVAIVAQFVNRHLVVCLTNRIIYMSRVIL